jgi:hypothetical protein
LHNNDPSKDPTIPDTSVPRYPDRGDLHSGDFIEYYATPFVCGDPKGHRILQIHQISGKGDDIIINTTSGDLLDWMISARKLKV